LLIQFFDRFSLSSDTSLASVSWVALGDFSKIGWSVTPNQTENFSIGIYSSLGTAPIFTQFDTLADYTTSIVGPISPGAYQFTASLPVQLQAGEYWISFFGEQSPMAILSLTDLAGGGFNSIRQFDFATGTYIDHSGNGFSLSGNFTLSDIQGTNVFRNPGEITPRGFCSPCTDFSSGNVTSGVPEASTWAMMLIGFAAIGFMATRKRRAALALR
jgi:hypothetical protein